MNAQLIQAMNALVDEILHPKPVADWQPAPMSDADKIKFCDAVSSALRDRSLSAEDLLDTLLDIGVDFGVITEVDDR